MLYLPQFMVTVLGYSPIGAGAGMLPMMATFAAVSFVAGNLYNRFGSKPLLILGSACIAGGPALIAIFADRRASARSFRGWRSSASGSASSIRPRRPTGSPPAASHGGALPERSSTCSRSPAARWAWA